jgi:hypothetical protein
MAVGRAATSLDNALLIHAAAAPLIFFALATAYFKKFNYTTPLQTALFFMLAVMALDAGIVAPLMEKSYAMFGSVIGTWLPFALIFLSTWLAGILSRGGAGPANPPSRKSKMPQA